MDLNCASRHQNGRLEGDELPLLALEAGRRRPPAMLDGLSADAAESSRVTDGTFAKRLLRGVSFARYLTSVFLAVASGD